MLIPVYNPKNGCCFTDLVAKDFIVSLYREIKNTTSFLLHPIIASYRGSLASDSCSLESDTEDSKKRC